MRMMQLVCCWLAWLGAAGADTGAEAVWLSSPFEENPAGCPAWQLPSNSAAKSPQIQTRFRIFHPALPKYCIKYYTIYSFFYPFRSQLDEKTIDFIVNQLKL